MSEPQGYTQAFVDILNSKLGQSITQAFTAGEEQERERIIASLGNCPCNCPTTICDCGCGDEPEFTRNELIALIKGDITVDPVTMSEVHESEPHCPDCDVIDCYGCFCDDDWCKFCREGD